jgi:phospholipid/cholesterol/gamma-HCH transport system substrate-binding protein
VGGIADVKLRDDGFLDVFIRVNNDVKVPKNSKASVKPIGIFGDAAIALTPAEPSKIYFQPGDTVPTGPSPVDIQAIEDRVDSIGKTVQLMVNTLNKELIQAGGVRDMRKTMANTELLSANANRLALQLTAVVAEQNRNVSALTANLRRATSAIDSAQIDSTVRNFRKSSETLMHIAANLDTTSKRASNLVTGASNLMSGIERGEGNVGKLMKDTLLYSDLHRLISQADSVLADIKANPKKYINVRIF